LFVDAIVNLQAAGRTRRWSFNRILKSSNLVRLALLRRLNEISKSIENK